MCFTIDRNQSKADCQVFSVCGNNYLGYLSSPTVATDAPNGSILLATWISARYRVEILEEGDNTLTPLFRELISELYEEMVHLDQRISTIEDKLKAISVQHEDCQRLLTIPGVGLLTATALIAAIGDITVFKSGRELAAWLGLVPRQHSTGGKPTLLGISKRGDSYLRTLLIHGGRSVSRVAHQHHDSRNQWIDRIKRRRGENISNVAVANKNARIAWALLTKKECYQAAG